MSPTKKTQKAKSTDDKTEGRRFKKATAAESTKTIIKQTAPLPFDVNLACEHIRAKDKTLAKFIDRVGPCWLEVHHMNNCYESLMESIVYQQLTGKAAATIMGRVKALFGDKFPNPKEVLETDDAVFRGAGLSGAKTAAIKDLSAKTLEGLVPNIVDLDSLSDEEIVELLTKIRGIGQWTVQMLLIFRLGRPDVLPVNDYGVRKGFAKVYKLSDLPTPSEMTKKAEKWKPYRSIASWYLWRVLELD